MERSWRPLEPKKVSLEASWSRLGALKIAPRWPDRDRPEVGERLTDHLSLALALGSATIKEYRLKTTTLYAGSEHAMGERPGEFIPTAVRRLLCLLVGPSVSHCFVDGSSFTKGHREAEGFSQKTEKAYEMFRGFDKNMQKA